MAQAHVFSHAPIAARGAAMIAMQAFTALFSGFGVLALQDPASMAQAHLFSHAPIAAREAAMIAMQALTALGICRSASVSPAALAK